MTLPNATLAANIASAIIEILEKNDIAVDDTLMDEIVDVVVSELKD